MAAVSREPRDPNTGTGKVTATPGTANSPANSPAFLNAEKKVYGDLNSGNYTDAWNTALGTSSMFGTGMSATTTDPLLQALETSKGLSTFDPTKKWDANSLNQYYSAFNSTGAYHGNNTGTNGFLGKNPYGDWGAASAITSGSDQKANIAQEGATPDVARFAGAKPTHSFLSKYGGAIVTAVGDVAGTFVGDPMAGNQIMALYDATQGNWGGALTNAASSFVPGVGSALSSATGMGAGLSGGLVGAGVGAAGSALSGGNPLVGAITGGVGGALAGSGGTGSALGNVGVKVGTGLAANAAFGGSPSNGASGATAPRSGGGSNYLGAGAVGAGALGAGAMMSGGQGNNGNMAGTDTTLAQTITGALPGVLQGAAGIYGSQNAAEKQTQADQNAIGTQTSTLGNINNIWGTQQGLGQGADKALGSALGTNGQPADYSGFENMPGYKFAVQQGTQAIQRQAASMGSAYTPNTSEAIGQYVTGTAAQDYNTYISQLMGAAGLGTTANQGLQTGNQTVGNNISQLQQNQGQAQASGVSGAANAVGGLFGQNGVGTSLIGAAGRYLNGGAGGGGGSNGGGGSSGGGSGGGIPGVSNMYTGAGNGTFNSGVDPSTGQSWVPSSATSMPSFDPNSVDMPTMPGIDMSSMDTGSSMNDMFSGAGSADYGSDAINYLGF
jgi:hypothetical protein